MRPRALPSKRDLSTVSTDILKAEVLAAPGLPAIPALPQVGAGDLYAALLADARKEPTRRAREQDIADLGRFLGVTDPRAVCAVVVAGTAGQANAIGTAYLRHLLDRRQAPATVNRRLSTLRRLVKLGGRFGVINWSLDLEGLKVTPYRDTSGPGAHGMGELTERVKAEAVTPKGKRDWALVALFYSAGLRRAELAALDHPADLDLDRRAVRVTGKGRFESAWLPMSGAAAEAIAAWLAVRGGAPGPLFVRLDRARRGLERLTTDGIHHIIGQLGRRAGLARSLAPHQLRHAAITRLSELTGGDLRRVREFSRHAKLDTVAVYVDRQRAAAAELAELLGRDL